MHARSASTAQNAIVHLFGGLSLTHCMAWHHITHTESKFRRCVCSSSSSSIVVIFCWFFFFPSTRPSFIFNFYIYFGCRLVVVGDAVADRWISTFARVCVCVRIRAWKRDGARCSIKSARKKNIKYNVMCERKGRIGDLSRQLTTTSTHTQSNTATSATVDHSVDARGREGITKKKRQKKKKKYINADHIECYFTRIWWDVCWLIIAFALPTPAQKKHETIRHSNRFDWQRFWFIQNLGGISGKRKNNNNQTKQRIRSRQIETTQTLQSENI